MTRMQKAMAAVVVVLAAAAASAQETDPETRFHRAYEHEVVDGKVADAAREYLAMMGDEKFPERLRQEAKFRFAVTAMLLGRADEARVHLTALAADAKAPEALRARATEYLDAAKGVGAGNEIDKKLQSLVFDLAKKSPADSGSMYRDFEVLGRTAVPFVRQLLDHDDRAIRNHAYRILLRLGESGMGEAWRPEFIKGNGNAQSELSQYLWTRPAEVSAFERRLLALDEATLYDILANSVGYLRQYDAATLRAFASRKVPAATLRAIFPLPPDDDAERVRSEWIASDDADLSAQASLSYLEFANTLPKEAALRTDLFPGIVARLSATKLNWRPTWVRQAGAADKDRNAIYGFVRLGAQMPADTLLATFEEVVTRGAAAPTDLGNPLKSGLADLLAIAIEMREPDSPLPARYGELLRTWLDEANKRRCLAEAEFTAHLRQAASRMPKEAAEALVTWAVTTPLADVSDQGVANAIPTYGPQDVPVALAAIRAARPIVRDQILAILGPSSTSVTTDLTADFARALTPALPELVRQWNAANSGQGWPPVFKFVAYARLLPAEEARDRLVETAEAVAEIRDPNKRIQPLTQGLLGVPAPKQEDRTAYWIDVALPALDRVWPKLAELDRGMLLTETLKLLEKGPRDARLRAAIGRLVAAHYGDVQDEAAHLLAGAPDVFELTAWVPNVCPGRGVSNNAARVDAARADPAVRALTADPAAVNAAVLVFVRTSASESVQKETADRLIRGASGERLRLMLITMKTASPETLEDALARTLAEPSPDLVIVSQLVERLRMVRPSEKLFPAVRLLLRGEYWATGVATAKALGREELLPDLATLLDSMYGGARDVAKDAIDSIVALRKLKEEARRNAGGK